MEAKTKVIGQTTFIVQQLGAKDGFETLAKLTAIVGGALDGGSTGGALKAAGAVLVHEWPTVALLLKDAKVSAENGTFVPLDANSYFAGKYDVLFDVLDFALEINFEGFFAKLASSKAALLARLFPKAQQPLSSPPA